MKKHPDTKRLDWLTGGRDDMFRWDEFCTAYYCSTKTITPRQAIDKARKLK